MGVGVDINANHTIVVELSRHGARYTLQRVAILPGCIHRADAPPARASDGETAAGIARLPRGLRRQPMVLSLPGRDVMFRLSRMGAESAMAVSARMRRQVQNLADNAGSMVAAHCSVEAPDGMPTTLVGVAREELIEHHAASHLAMGLSVACLMPRPIALWECLSMSSNLDRGGVQVSMHLGEDACELVFSHMGSLMYAASVDTGMAGVVAAVAQALAVNLEQARERLFLRVNIAPGIVAANIAHDRAVAAAQEAVARLLLQVQEAMEAARLQLRSPSLAPAHIEICGPGATIRGMREFLAARLSAPVEALDPLTGVDTSGLADDQLEIVQQYAGALAIPLGLARYACHEQHEGLTFVPPRLAAQRCFFGHTLWLYAGLLALLVALGISYGLAARASDTAAERKQEAALALNAYLSLHRALHPESTSEAGMPPLSVMERAQLVSEERVAEMLAARQPGLDFLTVLGALGELFPQACRLIEYRLPYELRTLADGTEAQVLVLEVAMDGEARQVERAYADLCARLRAHPVIASVADEPLRQNAEHTHTDESGYRASITLVCRGLAPFASGTSHKGTSQGGAR